MDEKKYLESAEWIEAVKGMHIFLDSDFIIKCIEFSAEDILGRFSELNAVPCLCSPVKTELCRVDKPQVRADRLDFLTRSSVLIHDRPLNGLLFKSINKIQQINASLNSYPSFVDLILSAYLHTYAKGGKALLLTGNVKDFPLPLFERKGHIILQNDKKVRVTI